MVVEAKPSDEFFELLQTFRDAATNIRTEIYAASGVEINPIWIAAVNSHAPGIAQQKTIAQGARADAVGAGLQLKAATSSSPLSGGLVPSDQWYGYEFGATPKVVTVLRLRHERQQLINVQFYPRNSKGKVAYAALTEIAPKIVGVWANAVEDGIQGGNPEVVIS